MKGIVFTVFGRLVEERFGIDTWDAVLSDVAPASEGAYTAAASYDDGELFALVGALSLRTGVPAESLVRAFGEFTLGQFARLYPSFFESAPDAKALLKSVQGAIHVEVRKLYPDAGLPDFRYEDPSPDRLVMEYRSPRKLCRLAEGLINGTARHYGTTIDFTETRCLHRGDDCCRFELRFRE